jgi:hypothetical protein
MMNKKLRQEEFQPARSLFMPAMENVDQYEDYDYLFGCDSDEKKEGKDCDCVQTGI